jgi:hypothetical protein
MIPLDIADLVVVAGGTLGIDTDAALELLDLAASGDALADAQQGTGADPAMAAAALLHALIRHHPFRTGNDLVAVAATVQLLAVNGWQANLDPPAEARAILGRLAAGDLATADLAAWLSPRLSSLPHSGLREPAIRRWLPRRKQPARPQVPLGRLTRRARQVIVAAQEEARGLGHHYVGTEHILLGLLRDVDGVAGDALASLGISPDEARQQVRAIIGSGLQAPPSGHIPLTPRARKAVELSLREAMRLDQLFIRTEHILLGLLREGDGVAAQVLAALGADLDSARRVVGGLLTQHAGLGEPSGLPDIREVDEQIAEARRQKDAALDAGALGQAASLRRAERRLVAERASWAAERLADDAVAPADRLEGLRLEGLRLEGLRTEVARLRGILVLNGIDPADGNRETA